MSPVFVHVGARNATWVDTISTGDGVYAVVVYADDHSVALVQVYNLRTAE